ncbi:MAG: formylmethanofuran dehydrogenase subunit E family protein [Desulfuromonadales bacterium]|nr:formylmethanofuran dehydrogenase subunit E family protein [Desulfuromonadales bacterium]
MIEPPEIFARIYARHGHRCPMSTLGGRLGLAAMHFLDDSPGTRQAVYSQRTCALDGIAEATGCREDAGSLVVKNAGRHALLLSAGQISVEVELTAKALAMAGGYRSLCNHLESGWEELTPDEQVRRRAEMEAMLDELLPQFWQAGDGLLVQKVSG